MAEITITPTTATFSRTGGQGTLTLTDSAASWHESPQSGDNWAALRERTAGVWGDWFVFGKGGASGDYLPLSGGEMTGNIIMPTGAMTNTGPTLYFRHSETSGNVFDAYVGATNSGTLSIFARDDIRLRPGNSSNHGLIITTTDVTFNGASILGGSIQPASAQTLGGIKIGYSEPSGQKKYAVQLDDNNQAFVHVPWSSGSGGSTVTVEQGTITSPTYGTLVGKITVDGTLTSLYAPKVAVTQTLSTGVEVGRIKVGSSTTILYAPDVPLNSYLPLTAGSGKALTGTLYSRAITPTTSSTSQSTGYDLGGTSAWWKNTYTRRVYLADGIYVYYDSTNNCIRTNAPIVSDSYISAGGVSTT